MLTPEENDLLCRVEGDAPMGQLMRRHWIAAAGAVERLAMRVVDYVPSYRSEAGSGVGMGFAVWQ